MIPTFQYTYFLYLLALLPIMLIVFLYARGRKKKTIKKIGDELLVKQLLAGYKASSYITKFLFLFLAMGLLVLAFANPRIVTGNNQGTRNGVDVMIAVDVSKSMLAQDIKPNRLERAKQLLSRLIDRLKNDRIGIVVFAGKAYLQMPISADHSAAKMYLTAATPESIPTQGTVIGDALKMCYASFNSKEKKYKAVVLISDGEDHDEGAIKVAKDMADEGIVIHTVGIGSREGAPIMDESTGELKKDAEGNTVITKLNEEELASIAKEGDGVYQYFSSNENVISNIENQLANMDQRSITDESLMNYKSYFQYALGLAFLFLLLELFVRETIRSKPIALRAANITLLFLFLNGNLFAQNDTKILKDGNDAYKKKDFSTAETAYSTVLSKDPANTTAQYNLGNALYKSGKKDSAIVAFDASVKQLDKPVEKSKAYYNKGVVMQNDKKIAECIDAYKAALKLTPNDDDARQNLQKALKQQKQQDQKDKDKKQNENQDKQKQPKPQQSKITKQDAEEKLKALQQQEKALQDKLHKVNAQAPNKPEKDW